MQTHYIPIFAGMQAVGAVCGDTFRKTITGSKHFLRRPAGIALDVGSLDAAEQAGALWVTVTDKESGVIYRASIAHIRQAGISINRGFGAQVALPFEGWTKSGRGLAEQLSLWA